MPRRKGEAARRRRFSFSVFPQRGWAAQECLDGWEESPSSPRMDEPGDARGIPTVDGVGCIAAPPTLGRSGTHENDAASLPLLAHGAFYFVDQLGQLVEIVVVLHLQMQIPCIDGRPEACDAILQTVHEAPKCASFNCDRIGCYDFITPLLFGQEPCAERATPFPACPETGAGGSRRTWTVGDSRDRS